MKYLTFIFLLCLASCAQMVPPSGGPKDTQAPMMMEEGTFPKNATTGFQSKTIIIAFDEYVKLNNASENIILSPAMDKKPDFLLKGKKLQITLNGDLKPNTTYTLNFGNAVTDITENNPAAGLTYVFSTGSILDSLRISGQVTNAFTNAPEKGVWVTLYRNTSDSAFRYSLPDYLAKTDGNGNYSLQNLAAGEYRLYALKDINSNYRYDREDEDIAFLSSTVNPEKEEKVDLKMFNESADDLKLKSSKFFWPGKMQLVFDKFYPYWNASLGDTVSGKNTLLAYKNARGDTVDFWFRSPAKINGDEHRLIVLLGMDSIGPKYDTLKFIVSGVKDKIPEMKLTHNSGSLGLYDKLKLKYDRPSFLYRKEKMHLYKNDSVAVDIFTENLGYGVSLVNVWEEKTNYTLILEDSVFSDVFYGKFSKNDTLRFITPKKDFYGNLFASIDVPDSNYVAELMEGDKVARILRVPVSGPTEFINLKPGNYKLRVFNDINGNWKWNTGYLETKKQPEKMYIHDKSIVIRSNWDFELKWSIGE